MNHLEEKLTVEMIHNELHQQIASEIGIENLLKLARLTGGQKIYIVKEDRLLQQVRDQQITSEYNGYNCKELARRYGLSQTQIRRICGRH